MKINKLKLQNFKCFKEEIEIELGKITLLTGENSSGKSSLMYGILSPLQSSGFPLTLSLNGKYVNLGDFIDVSYRKNKNNIIRLSVEHCNYRSENEVLKTGWCIDSESNMPKLHNMELSTSFVDIKVHRDKDFYIINTKINSDNVFNNPSIKFDNFFKSLMNFITDNIPYERKSTKLKKDKLWSEEDFKLNDLVDFRVKDLKKILSAPPRAIVPATKYVLHLAFTGWNQIRNQVNFISSFRNQPERTYYQKAMSDYKVGIYGDNHIDQILRWKLDKSENFIKLNNILRELKLLDNIKCNVLRGGRFEIDVKTQRGGVFCSLNDVGFGISQLLPVIVADLQLTKGSTMLIAQPEIHLHPSVQALIGDYFVNQTKSTSKRYIIETHSEYLLNRLRLSVVNKKIKKEDLSIYYFENTKNGTVSHKIEFTTKGEILNAPEGFFKTYMIDVMNIALNA